MPLGRNRMPLASSVFVMTWTSCPHSRQKRVAQKSRNLLRAPWAIDIKETPRSRTTLFLQAPGKDQVSLREEQTIVRAGHNSRIGRLINRKSVIGTKLGKTDYLTAITGLLDLLVRE